MLLNSIKRKIEDLPCITFEQFFLLYVMRVQDTCIDEEVSRFIRNSKYNVLELDKQIQEEILQLVRGNK